MAVGALNYIILTVNDVGHIQSGETTITFDQVVPTTGFPFMLVVSTPFEIIQADSQASTYVLNVTRRQEGTTNTSDILDGATIVCELTHEALDDMYGEVLAAQKVVGPNAASNPGTPDANQINVNTGDSKVYIGVSSVWEELAPKSHADLINKDISTEHTQYYTDTRGDTWHDALPDEHLGSLGGVETVSVNAGGANYVVDDVLTITPDGDDNCELTVLTLSGTAVATVSITNVGSGYSAGTGSATTGGSGTGCIIDIDSILAQDHDHIVVPAANMRELAVEPGDTITGGVYFNTATFSIYYYDGADWKQYSTVPTDAIIFREDGSCPSGWTEKTAWDGHYLKGETAATWVGGSGGATTHKHDVSTVPQHAHTIPNRSITVTAVGNHNHDVTGWTTGSASKLSKLSNKSVGTGLSLVGDHNHTLTVPQHNTNSAGTSGAESQPTASDPKYVELTICEKD